MQKKELRAQWLHLALLALLAMGLAWPALADDTKSAMPPQAQAAEAAESKTVEPQGDASAAPTADQEDDSTKPKKPTRSEVFPNLSKALRSIDGVVKATYATTPGGMRCAFGWFEDKEAVKRWYYSAVHQGLLDTFFPARIEREPMFLVPDDIGPMMALACFTPPKNPGDSIRQIAVELYAPLHGGFSANGRFGPDEWKDIFEHYDQYEDTEEYRQRMRDQINGRDQENPVTDVPFEAGIWKAKEIYDKENQEKESGEAAAPETSEDEGGKEDQPKDGDAEEGDGGGGSL